MIDGAATRGGRIAGQVATHIGVGALQLGILRQLGAVLGEQRQGLLVGLTPVLRPEYTLQVADGRPDAPEFVFHVLDRRHETLHVAPGAGVEQAVEFGTVVREHLADRGQDVLGGYLVEAGQRRRVEKRVGHAVLDILMRRRILAQAPGQTA
jgi:hypothetical protein